MQHPHNMQNIMNDIRNDTPRPTLEITTPAVRNPGVTVELVPGGVSGSGGEETQTAWLN